MKYHGNYCGPNWSAGLHQPSVLSDVPSIDEFDETCRIHDAAYASGSDLLSADVAFTRANFGKGAKRTAAAAAVGVQAAVRAIDKFIPKIYPNKTKMTKNGALRGAKAQMSKKAPKNQSTPKQSTLSTVPAAYGYTLRMQAPSIVRRGNMAVITGSDYGGTVQVSNSNNYQPAASVFINPAYFQNAMLAAQARSFEKFRLKRGAVTYIPSVPTSTQGQIVMLSTSTVKEPFLASGTTTFLGRALSQYNAVASPIWKEATIELAPSQEWSVVDALIDADLDDCIAEEVQVYGTCDSTLDAGVLVFHYEIEFKDPLYVYHPTVIPVPNGNGGGYTFNDDTAVNAALDAIRLSSPGGTLLGGTGSVYRCVFQQGKSIQPTGPAAWANVASINTHGAVNTTTVGSFGNSITLVSGTTLYGLLTGTILTLYNSYEGAAAGQAGGLVYYANPTTAAGTWAFLIQMVRLGDTLRVTTQ